MQMIFAKHLCGCAKSPNGLPCSRHPPRALKGHSGTLAQSEGLAA